MILYLLVELTKVQRGLLRRCEEANGSGGFERREHRAHPADAEPGQKGPRRKRQEKRSGQYYY